MIKTILFDMGGVIITISRDEAVKRFAALGLKDADDWLDAYCQKGIFGEIEEGKITDEEFRKKLELLVGRSLTWQECQHAWLGYMHDVPLRNLQKMQQLRARGYRVVLLSNTNPYILKWVNEADLDGVGNGLSHYLDAVYASFECGCMKPNKEFFKKVLEGEGVNPDEALFLDDGAANIKAASELGIRTFLVENGKDWTTDIDSYLELQS